MYVTPEKVMNTGKVSIEAALAIAQAQFQGLERLAALNANTAKAAFDDAAEHWRALFDAKDPQDLAKLNSNFAQPAVEKAVGYARGIYDVTAQTQANVVKLLETHSAEVNKAIASTLDNLAKNAPAGSDAAVTAVKTALAAFNSTYDSMSKAAKQAAEVVEVNFANATQTAKTAGKRR